MTQAFRSRLARIWTGETFEEGAPLVVVVMSYRILCNGIKRKCVKASPALAPRLFCNSALHKIRYGVVVVERGNEIVAMAESDLLILGPSEEPNFLPSGRYGHLNNVSVRNDMRGQGVGHTLVQAVFNFFETAHLDGYLLWFNPDNPLARAFWSRLGFLPVWRTYQRPEQG